MPIYHGQTIGRGVVLKTPDADGVDGQVITTDGNGNLSFQDGSGGGAADGENLGSGVGIFVATVDGTLQFRSLKSDLSSILITEDGNEIDFNATALSVGADPVGSSAGVQGNLDTHTANVDIHYSDAPADGQQYARVNNAWQQITGGGEFPGLDATYNWTGIHNFGGNWVTLEGNVRLLAPSSGTLEVKTFNGGIFGTIRQFQSQQQSVNIYSDADLLQSEGVISGQNGAVNFAAGGEQAMQIRSDGVAIEKPLTIAGPATSYLLPNADGSADQVLQTNGSGVVSWATVSGGGGDFPGVGASYAWTGSHSWTQPLSLNSQVLIKSTAGSTVAIRSAADDAFGFFSAAMLTTQSTTYYPATTLIGSPAKIESPAASELRLMAGVSATFMGLHLKQGSVDAGYAISFTRASGDDTTGSGAIDLTQSNHVLLTAAAASGNINVTVTPPANRASGTIMLEQGGTPRDLTWAVTGGTVKWLGTEPTWNDAGEANKDRIVSWHWDGSTLRLMASPNG